MLLKLEKCQNITYYDLTMTFFATGKRTTLFHVLLAFLINSAINVIKKARRAKKEVGKRSKLKQPNKIEMENRNPGTPNPNK